MGSNGPYPIAKNTSTHTRSHVYPRAFLLLFVFRFPSSFSGLSSHPLEHARVLPRKKKCPFDYHDCHQNEKGGLLFQFIYTISSPTASEHTVIRLYIRRYNRVPSSCRSRVLIYTNLCANSSLPFKIVKRVVRTDRGAFKQSRTVDRIIRYHRSISTILCFIALLTER